MDTGGSFTEIIVNPVGPSTEAYVGRAPSPTFKLLPRLIIFASAPQSGGISCSRAWTAQLEVASPSWSLSALISPVPALVSCLLRSLWRARPVLSFSFSSRSSQNNSIALLMPRRGRFWTLPPLFNLDRRDRRVASLLIVTWLRMLTINMNIELLCGLALDVTKQGEFLKVWIRRRERNQITSQIRCKWDSYIIYKFIK